MAGTSLLALLDDIALLMDDVAVLSKVALKKTSGVLGDDLALNAEQVSGIRAERELPVVWEVAKGSFKNKCILVPAALLISAVLPVAITVLLMIGGLYLCFEGFEKVAHKLLHNSHDDDAKHQEKLQALSDPSVDMVEYEQEKIKGAIRTDFILSAEIIVLTLGTVSAATFGVQVGVLVSIALGITVGVYGLVAAIVKFDDAGLYLLNTPNDASMSGLKQKVGKMLLIFAPYLMKTLSFVGTLAMFLVGGGIMVHGIPFLHHLLEALNAMANTLPYVGNILPVILPTLMNFIVGIIAGGLCVLALTIGQRIVKK